MYSVMNTSYKHIMSYPWYKKVLPDSVVLGLKFKKYMGYKLDLNNVQTFNEKLQWLKLHDRNPIYSTIVDKYMVKEYMASIIGEKYIIPTLGVWKKFEEIKFELLPRQFVLKCTHDSGGLVICDDKEKFNYSNAKKKIDECLETNFYWIAREWPYKNVIPQIIAEEYIGYYPLDYKFFTFEGEIDSVMVCKGRELGHPYFYFYDMKWERLYYQHEELEKDDQVDKPENFDEMISIVRKIAKGYCHLRVDLYNINGKIYFGECTFFDQGGYDTDITYNTDLMWGKKMNLDEHGRKHR